MTSIIKLRKIWQNRAAFTPKMRFLSKVNIMFVCLFVCFDALRPKSKAMVMAGWSVHLTTLFPGQA